MESIRTTIREIEVKGILTKSNLPLGGYSANPYVGCTHACKYCYASFMKRFSNHLEPWGKFVDVKYWPEIKQMKKYAGQAGLSYVRDDDSMRRPFDAPPTVVNYFFHEQIIPSAKRKEGAADHG